MALPKVLIIDDGKDILEYCEQFLATDYEYYWVNNGLHGIRHLKETPADLVLLDKYFIGTRAELLIGSPEDAANEGLSILRELKRSHPDLPVIMVTSYGDHDSAVAALRMGATDYIEWGAMAVDRVFLKIKIDRAVEGKDLKQQLLAEKYTALGLIGMTDVIERIELAAQSDVTVLITGETGTGKDVVARAIYRRSQRKDGPFVKVSCPNIPRETFESELFGHEKGAFTGADKEKPGRFELADGGTIFLDEIGDIPPSVQVKLLRVLEEQKFERLGGTETIKVDVRVIAATNKDLEANRDEFREDVYHRLNQFRIHIPPLRERKEDILQLINHFIDKYSSKCNTEVAGISTEALDYLCQCDFASGNVRELEDIILNSIYTAERVITLKDLLYHQALYQRKDSQREPVLTAPTLPSDATLDEIEKQAILQRLEQHNWQIKSTAESLGISRGKLYAKIKEYGLKKKG